MLNPKIKKKLNFDQFFATDFLNHHHQRQRTDFYTVPYLFPYNLYDQESKLFINDNSVGFLLNISPVAGFDESAIDRLSSSISSMEEFMVMQVINYASPDIENDLSLWQQDKSKSSNKIFSELSKKRVEYLKKSKFNPLFNSPEIVNRDFRIFLSVSISLDDFRSSRKSLLERVNNKENLILEKKEFSEISEVLSKFRNELKSVINSVNSSASDMNSDDLIDLVRLILSFDKIPNKSNHNHINPINREIVDDQKKIEVKDDYLVINNGNNNEGDFYSRTISVSSHPSYWSQNMNELLMGSFTENLQISSPFINSYSLKVISQQGANQRANARMVRATQLSESSMAKFLPNCKKKLVDARFVVSKLEEGNNIIETIHQFTIFSDNKKKLDKDCRDMQNILETAKFQSHIEPEMQLSNFLMQMPMIPGNLFLDDYILLGKTIERLSWTASNLIPLIGEWKGNLSDSTEIKRGEGLILFGRRGQLLNWSPFENEEGNFNVAVIGKSGSGKSFFMQDIVTTFLASDSKVFIIDDGFSFENTTKVTKGEFIEFSDKNDININPFGVINMSDLQSSAEYKMDVSNFLKNIIARMCRNDTECSEEEKGDISKAVTYVLGEYLQNKITPTINDIADYLGRQKDNPRATNLTHLLYNFTSKGVYGKYFNEGDPIDIANNLMNFELSKIKGDKHLLSVVMMSIMYLVSEYIYSKGGQKKSLIVIDEGWAMLSGGQTMVEFIEGLARRCRKYKGSLITGTQSIEDYTNNKGANACLSNSDWTIILSQKPKSLPKLQEIGVLTDDQIEIISGLKKNSKFSEMVITGPSTFAVGRFICDPFSAMLYSTKKEHRNRKNELIDSGHEVFDAIRIATKEYFNYE